jgi:hypothetical protein
VFIISFVFVTLDAQALPFACAEAHRNFTAYLHRFRMPFAESGAVNNMWHSFDYGLVHFVSISTETDFPGAPEGPGTYLNAYVLLHQMSSHRVNHNHSIFLKTNRS